jgi:hypothetical protein
VHPPDGALYVPDIAVKPALTAPVKLTAWLPSVTVKLRLEPVTLPDNGAVVAHGSFAKCTVPDTAPPFCVIDALPVYVFPFADDVTVNCQLPLRPCVEDEEEELPQANAKASTPTNGMPSRYLIFP